MKSARMHALDRELEWEDPRDFACRVIDHDFALIRRGTSHIPFPMLKFTVSLTIPGTEYEIPVIFLVVLRVRESGLQLALLV